MSYSEIFNTDTNFHDAFRASNREEWALEGNWFQNFIKLCCYIPILFIRFFISLPPSLTRSFFLYLIEAKNLTENLWLKTPIVILITLPGIVGYGLSCFSMAIIKFLHPQNIYNFIDTTLNSARLTIYIITSLLELAVCSLLDKIYHYDENIKKPGLRKIGALLIGILHLPFSLIRLITRAILFPFGFSAILQSPKLIMLVAGSMMLGIKIEGSQNTFHDASKQIFGDGPIAQKWNTFVGWFGKGFGWTFSIAGWAAISYFAFPAVITSICNWIGVTLPQTIAGLTFLSPAGTVAATVGATSIIFGIGYNEISQIESGKDQQEDKPVPEEVPLDKPNNQSNIEFRSQQQAGFTLESWLELSQKNTHFYIIKPITQAFLSDQKRQEKAQECKVDQSCQERVGQYNVWFQKTDAELLQISKKLEKYPSKIDEEDINEINHLIEMLSNTHDDLQKNIQSCSKETTKITYEYGQYGLEYMKNQAEELLKKCTEQLGAIRKQEVKNVDTPPLSQLFTPEDEEETNTSSVTGSNLSKVPAP